MKQDPYHTLLQSFKDEETPETILLVAGSGELTRISVAWTSVETKRNRKLSPQRGDTPSELWDWLWRNTEFSRDAFLARIPCAGAKTARNLDTLVANRVLYPDGTVNRFLQQYLRSRVIRQMRVPTPKHFEK
jgi:hypothetical protein